MGQKHPRMQHQQQFYDYHDYYYDHYYHNHPFGSDQDHDMYHYHNYNHNNNNNNNNSSFFAHNYDDYGNNCQQRSPLTNVSAALVSSSITAPVVVPLAPSLPIHAPTTSKLTPSTASPPSLPRLVISPNLNTDSSVASVLSSNNTVDSETNLSRSDLYVHNSDPESSTRTQFKDHGHDHDQGNDIIRNIKNDINDNNNNNNNNNDKDQSNNKGNNMLQILDNSQRLQPGANRIDSDISCNSSVRESSDCDTAEMDEDDKGLTGGSDSNDTEEDPHALDRRSRRARTMQRLVAKNKTLKLSLAQAKADLASERHNRAVIDQIYLKIKKGLNLKLEAEELKVAQLRAELEQMTIEMQELRQKSQSSTYKIGYDSSPYCLTGGLSGLGGLMLHHSNLTDDDALNIAGNSESRSSAKRDGVEERIASSFLDGDSCDKQAPDSDDEDDDEDSACFVNDRSFGLCNRAVSSLDDESVHSIPQSSDGHKVTFVSPDANVASFPPPSQPSKSTSSKDEDDTKDVSVIEAVDEDADEDKDEDEKDDDDDDEAPRTMMEILMKKHRSQSPEDEVQDPPADANETFSSMAHKFLHQAQLAKFTPARTILQLDDLLLKYDALPEELVFVLAKEFMKWWETERIEAGGPISGGWGVKTVMTETGDLVSAKVAVETKFKAVFVPLLLHYVATHKDQMVLLEKLESYASSNDKLMRNHTSQLMALYKFDVLDAEAILEWWKLLKEPQSVFGQGDGIRSMSSKFVAWLEDEEESDEDSDCDSDEEDEEHEDDEDEDSEDERVADFDEDGEGDGQGKILGLEFLTSPSKSLQMLDEDLERKEEMLVIGSDDGMDEASITSSLERIEECERKRRISFCTNNVYIQQNGNVLVKKAPVVDEHGSKLTQCPPMETHDEEEEEEEEEEEDAEGENENENESDDDD
ncbi:hypothetical protein BGZ94_008937 [Podila epigama]|nr:hypothetical protein BGZ94_008937 [Podila epigama]